LIISIIHNKFSSVNIDLSPDVIYIIEIIFSFRKSLEKLTLLETEAQKIAVNKLSNNAAGKASQCLVDRYIFNCFTSGLFEDYGHAKEGMQCLGECNSIAYDKPRAVVARTFLVIKPRNSKGYSHGFVRIVIEASAK
jgi:hypothetical protein